MVRAPLEEFATSEYWDTRYAAEADNRDGTGGNETSLEMDRAYDWFRSFDDLLPLFQRHLPPSTESPQILHLGCGNSINVDFSAVLIDHLRRKNDHMTKGIEWLVMDIRDMHVLDDARFDIAIDKGTLDAFLHGSLWTPPSDVVENVAAYVDEVARVLKPNGKWLYVSYRQPHFMTPMLVREGVWSLEVQTLAERSGGAGLLEYFAYVITKRSD
ncbi:MAG: hypothetical protein M1825_001033 [Sarcosagium campestre]|nr:MAG: hypothetical protein M1825_001033 [Sarcosagium campestre]